MNSLQMESVCHHCKEDIHVHAETGGLCTFCGAKVSLSKSGVSEVRASAAERLRERRAEGNAASSSGQQPSSSAESESTAIAEAKAFKDRLVRHLLDVAGPCHGTGHILHRVPHVS